MTAWINVGSSVVLARFSGDIRGVTMFRPRLGSAIISRYPPLATCAIPAVGDHFSIWRDSAWNIRLAGDEIGNGWWRDQYAATAIRIRCHDAAAGRVDEPGTGLRKLTGIQDEA